MAHVQMNRDTFELVNSSLALLREVHKTIDTLENISESEKNDKTKKEIEEVRSSLLSASGNQLDLVQNILSRNN